MRFLILDANYPGFLQSVYAADPDLHSASYGEQRTRIREGLFGEVNFQVDALHALGHEAESIIVNARYAQDAWAREHGLANLVERRIRTQALSWLRGGTANVSWDLVVAQVQEARPDVVYVGIMDTLPSEVIARIRPLTHLVVAQIAAPLPAWDFSGYDLILSSISGLVQRFRAMGIRSEWVPLAFDPTVIEEVGPAIRDVPVSFVGSITRAHRTRVEILEAIARAADLQTWTGDSAAIGRGSPLRPTLRGPAFGRRMYTILSRSRITINTHSSISGDEANNLRLYEATGMGCLLLTDHRRNLTDLFSNGTEIATFRTPGEAAELVRHFLASPEDASRIAAAGQARTIRDHTWSNRMGIVLDLVRSIG